MALGRKYRVWAAVAAGYLGICLALAVGLAGPIPLTLGIGAGVGTYLAAGAARAQGTAHRPGAHNTGTDDGAGTRCPNCGAERGRPTPDRDRDSPAAPDNHGRDHPDLDQVIFDG